MAKLLKLRRGSTSQHGSFTGAEGEVTVDTDKDTLVVHDGSTAGGHPVAAEDMANVSSASIAGRLATDSIATTKIAAGALPTDVTVADANISGNLTIANADVNSDAAIAGTKISPDFGSQDIVTTGNLDLSDSTGSGNNRIKLGASDDLMIYHDGNESYINDSGSGSLRIITDALQIRNSANSANRLTVASADGQVNIPGNLDVGSGVDVTGNITCTGTVDGKDISALGISGTTLDNGVTATTQSQGDNSTKVATTAYTDTAVSNLVDSAPGALNTLNELAAAINDDASFSTTITNSIATKLPLAGGTITGSILFTNTGNDIINFTGNATSDQRGIAFNDRTALSADYNDGYLRLNDGGEFTNGVHSQGAFQATGLIQSGSGFNVGNTNVINSSGQVVASRITGALPAIDGSALTGIVSIPTGMIMIWSGAANAIPSGFTLCDGNNNTPDLRDRFIVGAQNSYNVGNTGGATSGSDTVNISVSVSGTTGASSSNGGAGGFQTTIGAQSNHTHGFSASGSGSDTVTIATLPPYYALCYVMKT